MTDEEIKQLIASNAKSIAALSDTMGALSNAVAADREERRKEQAQLYQHLGRLASAQSSFYEIQADYYHKLVDIEERQSKTEATLAQILERVSQSN